MTAEKEDIVSFEVKLGMKCGMMTFIPGLIHFAKSRSLKLKTNVFLCPLKNCTFTDGKYLVLPSGELHIREVGPEDGYKSYQCRTKHRLTGETRLSATKGRLVITGKSFITISY